MNRFDLLGRLTKDVELSKAGEVSVARFTVAVNRPYKNKAGERETDFIQVKAWRELAENLSKFVKKGDLVRIEGRVETSNYEKDGEKKYVTEFVATDAEFLSSKKDDKKEEQK